MLENQTNHLEKILQTLKNILNPKSLKFTTIKTMALLYEAPDARYRSIKK
jgi:hypothetical protein